MLSPGIQDPHSVACGWLCLLADSSPVLYANSHGSPHTPCCFSPPCLCSRILSTHILPLLSPPFGYESPCIFGQSLYMLGFLATRRVFCVASHLGHVPATALSTILYLSLILHFPCELLEGKNLILFISTFLGSTQRLAENRCLVNVS